MRNVNKWLFVVAVFPIIGTVLYSAPANADTTLSIGGVTLTVPSNIYEPIGYDAISTNISFSNQSGVQLLTVGYTITDSIGKMIASSTKVGTPAGASGLFSSTWYGSDFSKAVKPLTLNLIVKNFGGVADLVTSAPLTLLTQPATQPTTAPSAQQPAPTVTVTAQPQPAPTVTVTAQPQPAPTVTVTAQPQPAPTVTVTAEPAISITSINSQIEKLMAQVTTLKFQLRKVCSAKPKPKGC